MAADDLMQVIDVSDTSMAASGTNKKVLMGNVGGKFLIEEIVHPTLAAGANFSSIPQQFTRLILEGKVRSGISAVVDTVSMFLNGDTTAANYFYQTIAGSNGSASAGEGTGAVAFNTAADTSVANDYSSVRLVIEGYAESYLKSWMAWSSLFRVAGQISTYQFATTHLTLTDPITQLDLEASVPASGWQGYLRLYGEF